MRSPKLALLTSSLVLVLLGGCAAQKPVPSPGGEQTPVPPSSSSKKTSPSSPPSAPAPAKPSSSSPSTASSPSTGSTGPAQTPDERRGAIDRRLDGSLGTFDETLRKEQEAVAQERDAREAAGSAESEGTDASSSGDQEPGSAGTESPATAGSGTEKKKGDAASRPGDLKSDKDRSAAGGTVSGGGSSVGEIPDGSDDDIVARRLRKAAEQETDPELKEKLWKEYIDYKKNAG